MKLSKPQKDSLAFFKKREGLLERFALNSDWKVREIIAAWPKVNVSMRFDASKAPADPAKKWAWLWSNCEYDPLQLSYLTGFRDEVFFPLIKAKEHRIIYPDGTISKDSENAILFPFMSESDKIKRGLMQKK